MYEGVGGRPSTPISRRPRVVVLKVGAPAIFSSLISLQSLVVRQWDQAVGMAAAMGCSVAREASVGWGLCLSLPSPEGTPEFSARNQCTCEFLQLITRISEMYLVFTFLN